MGIKDPEYKRLYDMVEEHLLDCLPEPDEKAAPLGEAMKYSLLAGGKRIRPVLLLASCELAGEKTEFALPFACACEYIQTYSLIHDDLPGMDDDPLRRGKPTNHMVYGVGTALLAGDGLLSAAYETITKQMLLCMEDTEKLKRCVRAAYELAKGTGCLGMISGQAADLSAQHSSPSRSMLNFIHMNKTAAFIKASVLCGAYLGGAKKLLLDRLYTYADSLGLAFQIVDDIEDVTSTPEERGKAVGGDSEKDKLTYPAVYGLEESKKRAKILIEKARNALSDYGDGAAVFNAVADYLSTDL